MNWQSADDATADVESDASAEAEKAMRLVGSPHGYYSRRAVAD